MSDLFRRKYSWCRITSLSTSSTRIQNAWKHTHRHFLQLHSSLAKNLTVAHYNLSRCLPLKRAPLHQKCSIHSLHQKRKQCAEKSAPPPYLRVSMDLLLPLEVWGDGELHLECGSCDGLNVHGELQLGELVDVLVDGLAHLGHADQLTDLVVVQVVQALEGEVLLLDLAHHFFRDAAELPQGRHWLPPGKPKNLSFCKQSYRTGKFVWHGESQTGTSRSPRTVELG